MPTLADHFKAILNDISLRHTSLEFDPDRDLFGLLRAISGDPRAKNIDVSDDPNSNVIRQRIKLSGIDPSLIARLAQAAGFSELPGDRSYETFDPGWIECLLNYCKYIHDKADFPKPAKRDDVISPLVGADSAIKIGIVGDWGTGPWDISTAPPTGTIADSVIRAMQSHNPDYAIHLGDVYYSGGAVEETAKFLNDWPFSNNGQSYSLNSNHEMYSGAHGYYGTLLNDHRFSHQKAGYFALTNSQWLIVGLDTAYYATSPLYQKGTIRDPNDPASMAQADWLTSVLQANPNKRVIIMTHHDGFDVDAKSGHVSFKPLYREISSLMQGVKEWWWYWGHVHTAIAYSRISLGQNSGVTPRCAGHGAIPYMPFQLPINSLGGGDVAVEWAVTNFARDPDIPLRASNGFALLTLTGANLKEEFYDENDNLVWSNS